MRLERSDHERRIHGLVLNEEEAIPVFLEAVDQVFGGTGTDLDLAQQESVLASQKASVPPLRQTLTQNVNALATLVSRPPESSFWPSCVQASACTAPWVASRRPLPRQRSSATTASRSSAASSSLTNAMRSL